MILLPKIKIELEENSVTLFELLVSIIFVSMLIMGIYSIEQFSNTQVVGSERRAKVQNSLTYALEHMSKNIQRANGNQGRPAIEASSGGFRVWVDCDDTPSDLSNDGWIRYRIRPSTTNELEVRSGGSCTVSDETLSDKIVSGSFLFQIGSGGNSIEISLKGRYDPDPSSTLPINPQVEMKTKLTCNSASIN